MDIKERCLRGVHAVLTGEPEGEKSTVGCIVIAIDIAGEESHSKISGPAHLIGAALESVLQSLYEAHLTSPSTRFTTALVPILMEEIRRETEPAETTGPGKVGAA